MSRTTQVHRSDLRAAPAAVWDWITSIHGIGTELSPLMKMTAPRGVERITDVEIEIGRPIYNSWILLFGFLPIDRSKVTLVEIREGEGFLEQSPMTGMKQWRHERRIEPSAGGCVLTDRLTFEPRFGTPVVRWFIKKLFEHRHEVLRRELGGVGR